jgi:glycosyltransferase involved in cell wall biosynthesis
MLDVSIILPTLSANNEYFRCLYSIRAAFLGRLEYEIICIVRNIHEFSGVEDLDLRIIQEDESGIYGAMNTGLKKATGNYIYFIGQDDILLPSAATAIFQGMENCSDIILADVFWGKGQVYKNRSSRSMLVWKNWCHQGIFYKRLKFQDAVNKYPVRFKVQADHYINIVVSGLPGLKLTKYCGCVAWYSSDGFSSQSVDLEFRNDFPAVIHKHFGYISWFTVVVRRMLLKIIRKILKIK